MRLLVCDSNPPDVHSALGHLDAPGASVMINPQWITPDPTEKLWIACGAPAVKMVQSAGWLSKKGGVEANRGKLFQNVTPDGWNHSISVGVTYAPQIYHIDYADFVAFQADIALYRRFESTGTILPKLGKYTYATSLAGVIRYLKAEHARTGLPVELALDLETEGLDPFNPDKKIVSVSATAKTGISDVVYCLNTQGTELGKLVAQIDWIAAQSWIKVVGANFKYDMLWLRVKWNVIFTNFTFDTCNGGSLCEENRSNTLNLHTKIYSPELGGYDDEFNRTFDKGKMSSVPLDALLPYAGGDTDACLRNYHKIRAQLLSDNITTSGKPSKNSLTSVYLNVVHPALKALHKMEYTGVYVDVDRFHEFGADLENRMNESMAHAASVLPKSLLDKYGGLNSTGGAPLSKANMIAELLFSPTGFNLKPTMVTEKDKKPSTAEQHLASFKDHPEAGPIIAYYLDYKSVSKMHSTYYNGFLGHLRADNRWHPSYIIHKQGDDKGNEQAASGTVTGRGSAVAPAFQCVSGDTEIFTRDGIRTAADLIDWTMDREDNLIYTNAALDVWGSEGFKTTSHFFRSWRADLLKVTFGNGNELTCTPEHPIKIRNEGWVKAKDLTLDDYAPMPMRAVRAKGPSWCSPILAEALGLITGCGAISMTAPLFYIEVPQEYGPWLQEALGTATIPTTLDYVEDRAVLTINFSETLPASSRAFLLALPDAKGPSIAPELRGTDSMYGFLRGFIRSTGTFERARSGRIRVKTPRRALALALLRETAMEGVNPPTILKHRTYYLIRWSGLSAGVLAERIGMAQEGWPTEPVKSSIFRNFTGMRVADVAPAGAGYVYDFTVPSTHDFYANGMLVHNTVPKHSYWGKRLRECIIAPPGHLILGRDYSQGELKVAACWAGETKMIAAYRNGIDLHTLTAATVNGMSYEEAMFLKKKDKDAYDTLRQNGKAGNFGLLYGMSAYGFMMYAAAVYGVILTLEQAEAMRDAFFDLYPGLPFWHDRQISEAQQYGHVRSPLGRIRHLPGISSPIKAIRKGTQNQAINSPIQGTLVDMMWMSMGIIEQERPQLLNPFGQVHDQGLWYVPEDQIDEALAYSGSIMEDLPFEAKFGWKPELAFNTDAEVGLNLASLQKIAA